MHIVKGFLSLRRLHTWDPSLDSFAILGMPKTRRRLPFHGLVEGSHRNFASLASRNHLIESGKGRNTLIQMVHVEMSEAPPNPAKEFDHLLCHGFGHNFWSPMFENTHDIWLDRPIMARHENRRHEFCSLPLNGENCLRKEKKPVQFLGRKKLVFNTCPVEKPEGDIEDGWDSKDHGRKAAF